MTTQSQAETTGAEQARPSLWQRLSPLLDVIGAVLIFGSWILSNAMSQRAQDEARTHQALIDRVRQYRLYDDFAHQISDILSDLVRTRSLVEYGAQSRISLEGKSESPPDPPTWTGMTATQIRELNDFVQDLAQDAAKRSASKPITQSIEMVQNGARALTKAFAAARVDYDRLVEQRVTSTSLTDDDFAAAEELRKRVNRLWHDHDAAKQEMLHVGDALLRAAAERSESARRVAKKCKQLSYAFYAIGTLLILFGRVKSALAAKQTRGD
ncbi:MAG: hypothetical protein ACR2NM_03655 [Bythopirellula sp.]